MIKRKIITHPYEKEQYYPLVHNRSKRKFYYKVGTTIESLINNEGFWWVIAKDRIYYVANKNYRYHTDRASDYQFVPDKVFYVEYDEIIAKLIKIIGYHKLKRKSYIPKNRQIVKKVN